MEKQEAGLFFTIICVLFYLCCILLRFVFFYCVSSSTVSCLVFVQGAGQDKLGIYVKSVVKGGAADVVSISFKDVSLPLSCSTNDLRGPADAYP